MVIPHRPDVPTHTVAAPDMAWLKPFRACL